MGFPCLGGQVIGRELLSTTANQLDSLREGWANGEGVPVLRPMGRAGQRVLCPLNTGSGKHSFGKNLQRQFLLRAPARGSRPTSDSRHRNLESHDKCAPKHGLNQFCFLKANHILNVHTTLPVAQANCSYLLFVC